MTKRFRTDMPPKTCMRKAKTLTSEQIGLIKQSVDSKLIKLPVKKRTLTNDLPIKK